MKESNTGVSEKYIKDPEKLRYLHEKILEPATKAASELNLNSALDWGEFVEKFSEEKPELKDVVVIAKYKNDKLYGFNFAFKENPLVTTSGSHVIANSDLDLDPEYYNLNNIQKRLGKSRIAQNTANNKVSGMGNMLAQQFSSDNLQDSNKSKAQRSYIDLKKLDELDRAAEKINTGEPVFDGLDLIRTGIQSGVILLRVIDAIQKNLDARKEQKELKTLEAIAQASEKIDDLKSKLPSNEKATKDKQEAEANKLTASNINLNKEEIKELISQAISYLERETNYLLQASNTKVSKSDTESSVKDKTSQQRLSSVNNNLEQLEKKLNHKSSPKYVHEKFANYFHIAEKLKKKEPKSEYKVKGKVFEEVILSDNTDSKSILVNRKNEVLYKAEYKNDKWHELTNNLSAKDIDVINNFPGTEKEAAKEYTSRYLVSHLVKELQQNPKDFSNNQEIEWKFLDTNKNTKSYKFKISPSSEQDKFEISGKDETNSNVFQAEVYRDGLMKIISSDIPAEPIEQLMLLQKSQEHQAKSTQSTKSLQHKPQSQRRR